MKFSEQWLREWVNPAISTQQLCDQLSMAGLEVGALTPVAGAFHHVVVGQILQAEQHPNADRLRVCQVDVGQASPLTIVCGAANARAGIKVAAALVGAELPGGLHIKQAKLRGVESSGMLCSMVELGIAEQSAGILELPLDAPVGLDVRDYLKLNDMSIEVDLTPNRADCLSVLGIAREVGVYNHCAVQSLQVTMAKPVHAKTLEVKVLEPAACPRYCGQILLNVDNTQPTPIWMQEQLRRSGLRSISLVVDITNYVLLLTGQPLHAFDADKLQGAVVVRPAQAGETIALLDGQTLTLNPGSLLIADAQGGQALAGIMGGAASAVSAGTRSIVLECAHFPPEAMAGQARQYGLSTDSSYRFERGVDPAGMDRAMALATKLLVELAHAQPGPVTEVVATERLPKPRTIALDLTRVHRFLGIAMAEAEAVAILTRLGFAVSVTAPHQLAVTVPTYRFDISLPEDLLEELARVHGYNNIPVTLPVVSMQPSLHSERVTPVLRLKQVLVDRGYHEVMTYSFIAPKLHQEFFGDYQAPRLWNPISSDMAEMRRSLLPGMLEALRYNLNRQQSRVRLLETGTTFLLQGEQIHEYPRLAGVVCGARDPEQWSGTEPVNFYDVKADVEALLAATHTPESAVTWSTAAISYLHPGQSALIEKAGRALGYVGALHPRLQAQFKTQVFVFELDTCALAQTVLPVCRSLSSYPSVRRDLALVMEDAISAAAVLNTIREAAGSLLAQAAVFDVYRGAELGAGKKSLAISLLLQEPTRTLTDEDVNAVVQKVLAALAQQWAVRIRE